MDSFFFFFSLFFLLLVFFAFLVCSLCFLAFGGPAAGCGSERDLGGGGEGRRAGAVRTGGQEAQVLFLLLQPTVVPGFIFIPKIET